MNSTNNKGQSDIIPESVISIPSQQLEMKDYNKYDHTHCFNQKESPCGIKGTHRCCLCLEPSPQPEECKCESFSKEILDTSECKVHKGDVISNEPEEWESRFEKDCVSIDPENGQPWLIGNYKEFIKIEIRKAEERGRGKQDELIKALHSTYNPDYYYNQAITDALKALPDEEDIVQNGNVRSWNYAISEARASLEALKK